MDTLGEWTTKQSVERLAETRARTHAPTRRDTLGSIAKGTHPHDGTHLDQSQRHAPTRRDIRQRGYEGDGAS
eukprot:4371757-Pleurochrysis_carterae.AAC.1